MRLRIPLLVLLTAALVWMGCEAQTGPDQLQSFGPSFARGGPTPDDCDLKGLPVRDYFPKEAIREVSNLLRDLSDACAEGRQEDALRIGFDVMRMVDSPRQNDYTAGGLIVAGVWTAMQYRGGLLSACEECASVAVVAEDVADALEFGAFAVRSSGDAPVVSPGEYPYIWGIEPEADKQWSDVGVVPLDAVLIYGVPLGFGALKDASLTSGYDWYVVAWWDDPDTDPLLVGTCVPSSGSNVALVSHEPPGGSPVLLPKGPTPSYCSTNQASLGNRLVHLASLALPLWPQPLNASAMVGVSGSGKAREFSPFHQYDVAPYADVTIEPLPDDGFVDVDLCAAGPCTTVTWLTLAEPGSTIASRETLRFTTEANSSSWADVEICVAPKIAGDAGSEETWTCTDTTVEEGPWAPIEVPCDARESAPETCEGLVVTKFVSNKTGSHRICVQGVGGLGTSGLAFEECTATFNIRP